jgi:3-oxoacyl-[acyl-carrier protein] reductase
MLLKGKTALITGASKGIGAATAHLFASEGANLILVARNRELLETQKKEIEQSYSVEVSLFDADVSDLDQVKTMFGEIGRSKKEIDIVVNNAGVMLDAALLMLKEDVMRQNVEVNLYGCMYVTQAAVKSLIRRKGGSVINLTSIVGVRGSAGQSAYAAAKSGVIGFTKSLSKELAALNIRVNAIAPGFIETDLVAALTEQVREKTLSSIGMKRAGKPEDVAKVALFLASGLSEYVTGQVIGVDGGMIL